MASSLVTRRPSLNSTGMSSLPIISLMALPPPWTSTGFAPMIFSSTMSLITSSRSTGSTIADPPYLITSVLPVMALIQGMASAMKCAAWFSAKISARLRVSYFMTGNLH